MRTTKVVTAAVIVAISLFGMGIVMGADEEGHEVAGWVAEEDG